MPTQEQVWEAAKRVRETGERVTQKNVLLDLRAHGIGGSERTIDVQLIAWKAAQGYEPRLELSDIPAPLKSGLLTFMENVWGAAMVEATARLEHQRVIMKLEREAAGQLLDETQIRAEATARENERLTALLIDMTTEIEALRREVAHLRLSEFWDRVIREIAEILPKRDWMTTAEIVKRLPPSLAQEAIARDKALTPGRVNRQMELRDHHLRFFERDVKAARYRKRPGWTGITQPPRSQGKRDGSAPAA